MADSLTPEQRSKNMASISGKNTKPELAVRRFLFSNGLRYRLHRKDLPGNPDIVLPRHRTVIFVNGCYWHRHPGCKLAYTPTSNVAFWEKKFRGKIDRDHPKYVTLCEIGWNVLIIWECEVKDGTVRTWIINDIRNQTSVYKALE